MICCEVYEQLTSSFPRLKNSMIRSDCSSDESMCTNNTYRERERAREGEREREREREGLIVSDNVSITLYVY